MAPEPTPGVSARATKAAAPERYDEQALVAAVLRRDRKATARFVEDYADQVYAYVRHRLAPRADAIDDVVQEIFLAALASLPQFAATSSLTSWLLGIARHKVEDYYRRLLREPEPLDEEGDAGLAETAPPIEEVIDRDRLEAKTRRVLRELPESYGVALLWRYWENRSVREMAEATGKTEKAIERLLARARARFRSIWEQIS
jgi:RNA polymerase sigma-70 factor (ECF subfamily)